MQPTHTPVRDTDLTSRRVDGTSDPAFCEDCCTPADRWQHWLWCHGPSALASILTGDPTRRLDGRPETDADRRFFDLRQAGYSGPIDQDGHPAASSTVPGGPVTVASTLRNAARYLSIHGWCQGSYYDQTAQSWTPAACLVGAVGMVCYGGPLDAPAQQFEHPGFGDFEAAMAWLDRWLDQRHGRPEGVTPYTAYDFNDAKGRTQIEVVAALLHAADAWHTRDGGA